MKATRALLLLALALAFLSRALVPAGWMPANAGGYAVILCTGAGPIQMWMTGEGQIHEDSPAGESAPDHPCIFASAEPPLPGLATVIPALLAATVVDAIAGNGQVAIGRGLAAPPPPSTGPPHIP